MISPNPSNVHELGNPLGTQRIYFEIVSLLRALFVAVRALEVSEIGFLECVPAGQGGGGDSSRQEQLVKG